MKRVNVLATPRSFTDGQRQTQPRISAISLLITAGMLLAGFADAQTPTVPLINITDPQPAQTYQTMTVHVTVHFSSDADASTFSAMLNGAEA